MHFSPGDIVRVNFPFSDDSDQKLRPALVISNSLVNGTKDIILAQLTTNPRHDDFSFEISENMLTRSLRSYSEVRCHKLFTASKEIVKDKISKVLDTSYPEIREKIKSLIS
jgi:mRNA interferase MazF